MVGCTRIGAALANPVNRMYDDDNIPLNELNDEWNSKKNNILFLFEVGGL